MVKPYVLSFCRQINSRSEPLFVPFRPLEGKVGGDCVVVVPEHVAQHGGEIVNGWAIWERRNALLLAEFHCCWKTPDGSLVDISPKTSDTTGMEEIFFLPDPGRRYEGVQIPNITRPLTQNTEIKSYLALAKDYHDEMNRGDLANQYGSFVMQGRVARIHDDLVALERKITARWGRAWTPARLSSS